MDKEKLLKWSIWAEHFSLLKREIEGPCQGEKSPGWLGSRDDNAAESPKNTNGADPQPAFVWHQSQSPGGLAVTAVPKTLSQRFRGISIVERQTKKRQKDEGRTEERLVWVPSLIPTNVGLTTTSCGSTYMARRSRACPRLFAPRDLNLNENARDCRRLPPDQVAVRETLPSSGLCGVSEVFFQQGNSNYHQLPVFITAAGWASAMPPFDEGLLRKSRRLKLKSKQLHKRCFLLFIPSLRKKREI